ncbi:MAG: hypothetical protein IT372_30820 [Polyangiaceae bacterium]|nr:hypothetical protein [Polyangiaceae bacterium]
MTAPMEDWMFEAVPAGSLSSSACSPDMGADPDLRGIRLHAPRRAFLAPPARDPEGAPPARVIVCGAYHMDSDYLGLREQFLPRILLVAVDAATHRARAGRVEAASAGDLMPEPFQGVPLGPGAFAGRSVIGYFNSNLAEALSLPAAEADYWVYATLGAYVSNVVRIEVRRPPAPAPVGRAP